MRCHDLYIAGLGYRLPAPFDVARAVDEGRYDASEQEVNDYASVTVSDGEAPPEMAARAARVALERSGVAPADVSVLLHASAWFQGIDYWPAASYVHREVLEGNRHSPALDVQQMCNGALGAVELAASYLAADERRAAALVTSADRFGDPGFDRWRGDVNGIVYGDGGAAAVLARDGFARLLSVTTIVDTGLEGMYRGAEPFEVTPGRTVDVRARRKAYAPPGGIADRTVTGLTEAVALALDEADCKLGRDLPPRLPQRGPQDAGDPLPGAARPRTARRHLGMGTPHRPRRRLRPADRPGPSRGERADPPRRPGDARGDRRRVQLDVRCRGTDGAAWLGGLNRSFSSVLRILPVGVLGRGSTTSRRSGQ